MDQVTVTSSQAGVPYRFVSIPLLHAANGSSSCKQCLVLARLFPTQVDFPNTTAFEQDQLAYWSQQQQQQQPVCRFSPKEAFEVSATILLSRKTPCPFAVRSGGHASFYNASNINGGIAIDLRRLNSIDVSQDRSTVSVGAGNRWQDVYEHIVPLGLAAIGGRNGDIGVGGLTLGGKPGFGMATCFRS